MMPFCVLCIMVLGQQRERFGEKLAIKSSVDAGRSGLLLVAEWRRPKTGWVEGLTGGRH